MATNNMSSCGDCGQAAAGGKHVIVEKPIAHHGADGEMLTRLARSGGCRCRDHMMGHNAWNRKRPALRCRRSAGFQSMTAASTWNLPLATRPPRRPAGVAPKSRRWGGTDWRCGQPLLLHGRVLFGSPIVKGGAVYLPKLMSIVAEDGAYIQVRAGQRTCAVRSRSRSRSCAVAWAETLSNLG